MPQRSYWAPRLAPDGQRLAVYSRGADGRIWIHDFRNGATMTLTERGGTYVFPVWTPDGDRVTFAATPGPQNLFWRSPNGSTDAQRLTTGKYDQWPAAWSPDGKILAFVQTDPTSGNNDIWTLQIENGRGTPHPWLTTRFQEGYPDWSPDGRWLTYTSDESGRSEVYVQSYPGPGPRYSVSTGGGISPTWSRDGREIFYVVAPSVQDNAASGTGVPPRPLPEVGETRAGVGQYAMMAVPVATNPAFSAGTPRKLFGGPFTIPSTGHGFDVTADGRRFVMVQAGEARQTPATQIVIVLNWFEELKTRVPSK